MSIFNLIALFGGLAMFLYGMRMMGDGLKESSSGMLKQVMERVTGTPVKAFLLGLVMTAVIQSSTATIVITAGLVGAGIISLHQSLGIIIGANVGTTVTGQIIRLLDLNAGSTSFLEFFKPSTLAPLALIIGIILIMAHPFKDSDQVGRIAMGFGILFSGLMNMTGAVNTLTESGIIESLFSHLGENPLIGYVIGAGVAFVLQSSSAAIGILQAFSMSGLLTFSGIYAVLMGIYLGDCVTTALVINIGSKPDAKRVGTVNILFNLCKTLLILIGVNLAHGAGLLNGLWNSTVFSGEIANTNSIFNLVCALLMLPLVGVLEQLSYKLVKDEPVAVKTEEEHPALRKLDALNPVFFSTPALALNSCYNALLEMFRLARQNIERAFSVIHAHDAETIQLIRRDEDVLDHMADRISNYLVQLTAQPLTGTHMETVDYYHSVSSEFERLGDHAMNIAECSEDMKKNGMVFSDVALKEFSVVGDLVGNILHRTGITFEKCDERTARHIEPLEEVVDDVVNALRQNHLNRLRKGQCSVIAGTEFLNMLSDIERISDICSNVGVATIAVVHPEMQHEIHDYVSRLHEGKDEAFNQEYQAAHDQYFELLNVGGEEK